MEKQQYFSVLFNILSSEQQISQRTDQKAFTLLSILGVFAVFFMVHYTKIPATTFNFTFIFIYFMAVLGSIFFLLLVISPRIRGTEGNLKKIDIKGIPTYFGGIVKFKDAEEYGSYLQTVLGDDETTYDVFVNSVYSIGRINSYKNHFLKAGIVFFIIAITSQIMIIISMYYSIFMEKIMR